MNSLVGNNFVLARLLIGLWIIALVKGWFCLLIVDYKILLASLKVSVNSSFIAFY